MRYDGRRKTLHPVLPALAAGTPGAELSLGQAVTGHPLPVAPPGPGLARAGARRGLFQATATDPAFRPLVNRLSPGPLPDPYCGAWPFADAPEALARAVVPFLRGQVR